MTTFSYTTGNPSNLVGGGTASMNDIQGPFTDLRTWANGSVDGDNLTSTAGQQLALNSTTTTRRGKSIITATESRTNVAYGTMTTPDQVTGIVLPTDGVLQIMFMATWQNSVASNGKAAIFIGANQLKLDSATTAPVVNEVTGNSNITTDTILSTHIDGLHAVNSLNGYTGDVTTGQVFGSGNGGSPFGGPVYVFAAAGTYTISVQFKSAAGSVTVKNRHLYVKAEAY